MRACILDYQSFCPDDLVLDDLFATKVLGETITWDLYDATQAEQTAERIADQDIILSNKVVLDEALLKANPQIKLIIILATGTNNVDLKAAEAMGIPVANIVAYSTESVVQQTFALLLSIKSQIQPFTQAVKDGRWCQSQFFGLLDYQINEVAATTLGIIGYGAIGKRVQEVAEALGMRVIIAESLSGRRSDGRVSLAELYQRADVVSVHSPLTPESNNLITAEAFAQMKPSAVLLNLGRGGIVNESDLAAALKNKQIAAAAIDVLSQEPPAVDHILLDPAIPNLLITPHTAWASRQARQQLLDQVIEILQSLGSPMIQNQVNNS